MTTPVPGRQLDLFRPPRAPVRQHPRTMHVCDAGDVPGFGRHGGVCFECHCCGYETGWLQSRGVDAERRGRVCPRCQGSSHTTTNHQKVIP